MADPVQTTRMRMCPGLPVDLAITYHSDSDGTGHTGHLALKLRLTSDQILTGYES